MKTQPRVAERHAILTPRQIYKHLDRYVINRRRQAHAGHRRVQPLPPHRRPPPATPASRRVEHPAHRTDGHAADPHRAQEILSVPFTTADATEYTEAGYKERRRGHDRRAPPRRTTTSSTPSAASSSSTRSTRSPAAAKAREHGAGSRDIGGEGVQQALLKLLEGREVFVPMNLSQHWNKHDLVQVNTQDVLFICAGTFGTCTSAPRRSRSASAPRPGTRRAAPSRRVTRRSCSTTACSPVPWAASVRVEPRRWPRGDLLADV